MESVKQWFFKSSNQDPSQRVKDNSTIRNETKAHTGVHTETGTSKQGSETSCLVIVDPKVAEFFKDFPEPYRQRLIERYSSREGFFRFGFIRDISMKQERDYAARGVILEEQREKAERKKQQEEEYVQKMREEFIASRKNREVPDWEKSVMTVIPLQEGETMGLKLIQTANFSALGLALVWAAVRKRNIQPPISKLRLGFGIVGSLNLCAIFQTCAVYRLMDWGIFDQTIDERDIVVKAIDELKKSFTFNENAQEDNKPDI